MSRRLPAALREPLDVVVETANAGSRNMLGLYAPAIAYALVLSLAPLTIAFNLLGMELIRVEALSPELPQVTTEQLYGRVTDWAGSLSSIVAVVLVFFGASTLFVQLVRAIERIWGQSVELGFARWVVRGHLFSFLLLAVALAGLFVSAVMGAALSTLTSALGSEIGVDLGWIATLFGSRQAVDVVFAFVLFTVAFTTVPQVRPRLRDVALGSLLTAVAYAIGQWVLSSYLSTSVRFTLLGAFGALLALLVWAYYTAAIMLWGAELTHTIARRRACRRGGADTEPYSCPEVDGHPTDAT